MVSACPRCLGAKIRLAPRIQLALGLLQLLLLLLLTLLLFPQLGLIRISYTNHEIQFPRNQWSKTIHGFKNSTTGKEVRFMAPFLQSPAPP